MGEVYYKPGAGWVSGKEVFHKTASGWVSANNLYYKPGAGWVAVNPFDTDAPSYPVFIDMSINRNTRDVTMSFLADPNSPDLNRMMLKYSSSIYPVDWDDGVHEWPGGLKDASPGEIVSWTFRPNYYNKEYFVSVWCIDEAGNGSDRNRKTVMIQPPDTTPPTPVTPTIKKVTYNCDNSGTWNRTNTFWSTSLATTPAHGGLYGHRGGWFYGSKITTALKNAKKIRGMTIKVQRQNSAHGVSGPANVYLIAHKLTNKGSGSNNGLTDSQVSDRVKVGTLERGQTKTFTVPAAFYAGFLDGTYKGLGLGLRTETTGYSSPDYIICNGKGTTSGQLYIEFEE